MGLEALDAHRIANPVEVVLEVYSVGVSVGVKPHGVGAHDVDGVELAFLREDRAAGVAVVGAARDAVHGDGLDGVYVVALDNDLHAGHVEPVLAVAVLVVIGDRRVFLELLRGFEVKEPDVGLGRLSEAVDIDGRARVRLIVGEVDLEDVRGRRPGRSRGPQRSGRR